MKGERYTEEQIIRLLQAAIYGLRNRLFTPGDQ